MDSISQRADALLVICVLAPWPFFARGIPGAPCAENFLFKVACLGFAGCSGFAFLLGERRRLLAFLAAMACNAAASWIISYKWFAGGCTWVALMIVQHLFMLAATLILCAKCWAPFVVLPAACGSMVAYHCRRQAEGHDALNARETDELANSTRGGDEFANSTRGGEIAVQFVVLVAALVTSSCAVGWCGHLKHLKACCTHGRVNKVADISTSAVLPVVAEAGPTDSALTTDLARTSLKEASGDPASLSGHPASLSGEAKV